MAAAIARAAKRCSTVRATYGSAAISPIGWQAQDTLWQGNFAKFDPNGHPLSPITTGYSGGGFAGGTFGNAVDANDNVWLPGYGGKSISKFDRNGSHSPGRTASHSTASSD